MSIHSERCDSERNWLLRLSEEFWGHRSSHMGGSLPVFYALGPDPSTQQHHLTHQGSISRPDHVPIIRISSLVQSSKHPAFNPSPLVLAKTRTSQADAISTHIGHTAAGRSRMYEALMQADHLRGHLVYHSMRRLMIVGILGS